MFRAGVGGCSARPIRGPATALLNAIACGLPVVATRACGLGSFPQVRHVEFGDKNGLRTAITEALSLS